METVRNTLGSLPAMEAKNFSLPTSTPAALGPTMGSSKGLFMVLLWCIFALVPSCRVCPARSLFFEQDKPAKRDMQPVKCLHSPNHASATHRSHSPQRVVNTKSDSGHAAPNDKRATPLCQVH